MVLGQVEIVERIKGPAMSIAEQAKRIYELRWKAELEANHRGQFVAIEPVSESYFLAADFIGAAMAAKSAFPDRTSFVLRIGHAAAFQIGGCDNPSPFPIPREVHDCRFLFAGFDRSGSQRTCMFDCFLARHAFCG